MVAALAGYAFAWLDFPGRDWLFVVVIGLLVVPLQMALIPMFTLYNTLGIFDTVIELILFHTAFGLPFAIFLLRNFFIGIPKDILESARIDGASEMRIFLRLILPLGLPAIASLAIFQFLWTWNDLLVALTFGRNTQPITVAIFIAAAPVRREHRPDRAGVVRLARRAARRLLRVPALLRPGAAGGLRQVTVPRAVAVVGGGPGRRSSRYATLRHGGLAPGEIAVFGDDARPAAAWRRRAAAIRQRRDALGERRPLPADLVPGPRGARALRRRRSPRAARSQRSPTATTRPSTSSSSTSSELRARSGWDESFVRRGSSASRAVDGGFELDGDAPFRARAARAGPSRA